MYNLYCDVVSSICLEIPLLLPRMVVYIFLETSVFSSILEKKWHLKEVKEHK